MMEKEVFVKITPVIIEETENGYLVTINGKSKEISEEEYNNTYSKMVKGTSLLGGIRGSIYTTVGTYQKLKDTNPDKLSDEDRIKYESKMKRAPEILLEIEKLKRVRNKLYEIIYDNNKEKQES